MDAERKLLLKMLVEHKSRLEEFSEKFANINRIPKTTGGSAEARQKGNELFRRKDHDAETHREIFYHYCESISSAPLESEVLAQAYGNRSAFLLHIGKYEECIKDIDRTLKFTKSDVLIIKLLCRKVECMKKLGSSNYQNVLNTAEDYAKKLDKNDKAQVEKMIKKAKECSLSNHKVPRNQSIQNDIVLPRVDEPLDCISIEHNDEYGRHLIAQKDYKPGDFILIENLYVTQLNSRMNPTNCSYCLKVCWTGIPCDYCTWAMFCNEDCKKKAWDMFHDVECSVMPQVWITEIHVAMHMSLRMLLLGIREAGSIKKLREELKLVDHYTDTRYKGFYKNDRFTSDSIQSVYSLKSRAFPAWKLDSLASDTLAVIISIVKYSQLIKNLEFEKIDDISTNEDLLFLGSLLLKFTTINCENRFNFHQMVCRCERLKIKDESCCGRGPCLSSLVSLINHSCNPNASIVKTEDKKIGVYALQPIKKNSQIFISYAGNFYDTPIENRKQSLNCFFYTCQCKACVESWPVSITSLLDSPLSDTQQKLLRDCQDVLIRSLNFKTDFNRKDIKKVCKAIAEVQRLPNLRPDPLAGMLQTALIQVYSRIYGWKPPIAVFERCNY